jgi:hypothetical protein
MFILSSAMCSASLAFSQCKDQIALVPLSAPNVISSTPDFVRLKYSLSGSDSLLIQSHEAPNLSYATGFAITRDGRVMQRISLRDLPEMPHDEPEYADSFTALAVTRACGSQGPIFFLTMQYQGDLTSPALAFILVPSATGYVISPLPMFSGGVVEVSKADPFHFRIWDNLHEGGCEACPTPYEVTEYGIRNGKPVHIRKYRTRHLYNSGDFDDRRRIRFAP